MGLPRFNVPTKFSYISIGEVVEARLRVDRICARLAGPNTLPVSAYHVSKTGVWQPFQEQEFAKDWDAGMSVPALMRKFHIANHTVYSKRKQLGLATRGDSHNAAGRPRQS